MTSHETALLSRLSEEAQAVFQRNLRALDKLVTKSMSFPAFLDAYLRCVAEMYAATAAAIWVRDRGRDDLQLQVQINYSALGLEGDSERALPDHTKPRSGAQGCDYPSQGRESRLHVGGIEGIERHRCGIQ